MLVIQSRFTPLVTSVVTGNYYRCTKALKTHFCNRIEICSLLCYYSHIIQTLVNSMEGDYAMNGIQQLFVFCQFS